MRATLPGIAAALWVAVGLAAGAAFAQGAAPPAPGARAGDLAVERAWSHASLRGVKNGAAFLVIANRGQAPDRLVGASSPLADKVELHTHLRDGDIMRMRQVPAIELKPGETLAMGPGGLHVMLLGLKQPLEAGGKLPLTLTFERAGRVEVMAAIEARGAGHHGGHQHRP